MFSLFLSLYVPKYLTMFLWFRVLKSSISCSRCFIFYSIIDIEVTYLILVELGRREIDYWDLLHSHNYAMVIIKSLVHSSK